MSLELPLNWVPRWNGGYYSDNSKLKQVYARGIVYYLSESRRFVGVHRAINFWGETWQPRSAYVAKYTFPETHIPHILIQNTAATANVANLEVKCVKTIGDFLYENEQACYFYDGKTLRLRNLEEVSYSVQATSGQLSLTSTFSSDPILSDSPIVVQDSFGNLTFVDTADRRFSNNVLAIEDGTYTVRYLSQTLCNRFSSGGVYITIDGEPTFVASVDLENVWDTYADTYGADREDGESNLSLKTKCQQLSLVSKPELNIEAKIGDAQFVLWDTGSSLSFSSSSIISAEVVGNLETVYVDEYPEQDGSTYILTFTPNGVVQVFYNTIPVPSTEYSISGAILTPLNNKLINAERGSFRVTYRTNPYTISDDGTHLTSITNGTIGRELCVVVVGRKVRIVSTTKRQTTWQWGRVPETLLGDSTFN